MNTSLPSFSVIQGASQWYANSGMVDWDWYDGFDQDRLIEYLYRRADGERTASDLVCAFLRSAGECPSDFGLGKGG